MVPSSESSKPCPRNDSAAVHQSSFVQELSRVCGQQWRLSTYWQIQFSKPQESFLDLHWGIKLAIWWLQHIPSHTLKVHPLAQRPRSLSTGWGACGLHSVHLGPIALWRRSALGNLGVEYCSLHFKNSEAWRSLIIVLWQLRLNPVPNNYEEQFKFLWYRICL